jgi:hypothetical protein
MTQTLSAPAPARLGFIPAELFRRQPALATLGLMFWVLLIPTLAAAMVDPRQVDGVETWAKPAKFLAALGLFALTSAWMFGYVAPDARRGPTARATVAVIIAASLFEAGYIAFQGARAERSHFNLDTPFHAAMYELMGVGAVALVSTSLTLAWLVARRGIPLRPAFRDGVVLGLVLTFALGGGFGGLIGGRLDHAVGAEDLSRTLPLFGWSLNTGDLRPAHFMGIHAQQLIPVFAALVPGRGWSARLAVWAGALAYAVFAVWVLLQALAGQPLFRA